MKSDLDVDAGAMHDCASAVAGSGARVAAGAAQAPPAVLVPRWATADTASALTAAAQAWLATTASHMTTASRQLTATADDYMAADVRAAHRLRAVR
jgi:hypothetical protein